MDKAHVGTSDSPFTGISLGSCVVVLVWTPAL